MVGVGSGYGNESKGGVGEEKKEDGDDDVDDVDDDDAKKRDGLL